MVCAKELNIPQISEHDEEYAKYATVFGRQSERGRGNAPE